MKDERYKIDRNCKFDYIDQVDNFGKIWLNLIKQEIKLKIWRYISLIISSEIWYDQVWSVLIHFDPIWSILIYFDRSDSIWSKIYKVENLMIYFNDYLIRNQMWSSLVKFDPFWTDLIHFDQEINKFENSMVHFNDYFIRNPIWSSLIHFGLIKKLKIENLMIYFNDYFIRNWKCGKSGKFD